ncbi:hypothetical protein A6U85_31745 [Agrobacterium sp. 13-626]|nr:hypothetical protein CN09_00895 [Rhizobium rhizogenes]MQB34134.1 hypothetical protein [Rhizobium rhizogenes]OCI99362.1 hypothetical protein A6U85_31745 [Agrobacterium sp. 13-626]OCJ20387.1 hypothetical protein A6U88_31830 [Agrobacterium sp. B131/95]
MGSLVIVPPPGFRIAVDDQGAVLVPPGSPPIRFREETEIFGPGEPVKVDPPPQRPPPEVPTPIFTAFRIGRLRPLPPRLQEFHNFREVLRQVEQITETGGVIRLHNEGRLQANALVEMIDALQPDATMTIYLDPSFLIRSL